jgi:hypothetical protein
VKLENIKSETDLRNWLTEWVGECCGRVTIEWVEPSLYGSSVGAPDCKIKSEGISVGLELKYLECTRKGIKWKVRPAQRRYHHMGMRSGQKSALLAWIKQTSKLVLVRGDHIPLRDYSTDKESGCAHGLVIMEELNYHSIKSDTQAIFNLEDLLFGLDKVWWV